MTITEHDTHSLRRWNIWLVVLHAAQGIAILALATAFTLPVIIPFMSGPPGSPIGGFEPVWELPLATFVAIFLFLAALDHLICALPGTNARYIRNLERGTNPFRWWEYSVSASLMMVLIAMITGVADLSALIAIFGANAAMILFGLAMEQRNPVGTERVDWRPFIYGCVVGAFPWIAVGVVLVRTQMENGVPGFVYGIYFSLLVLFFSFALNMWAHYARKGRFASVVSSERADLVLSLVAKSLLAWQVFASALSG